MSSPSTPATHGVARGPRPLAVFLGLWLLAVVAAWLAINFGPDDPARALHHFWPPWHPYFFNVLYATIAIIPATLSATVVVHGFGARTLLGSATALLAGGVVAWALGDTIWFWYNTCSHWAIGGCAHDTTTPYPSVADVGFLLLLPLWSAGLAQLGRMLGTSLRDVLRLSWIPLLIGIVTCWLMLPDFHVLGIDVHARSLLFSSGYTSKQITFSVLYLVSDVVIMSMALILLVVARTAAGGMLFAPLLATCAASMLLYAGDVMFDSRVASGKYFNGDISDLLYFGALFGMIVSFELLRRVHARLVGDVELAPLDDEFSELSGDLNTSSAPGTSEGDA